MFQRIKGTHDILDTTLFNFLVAKAKEHLSRYHFTEISMPILEPVELFKRSLGVTTDVVSKEMYVVNTGHESEEAICLRPEATASAMRAYYNNNVQERPWKVFTWGPMFRHERPQKGRFRQFNQISLEMIGASAISNDVYFMVMLDRFFAESLKLDSYALLINFLGCADDRQNYRQKLVTFLDKHYEAICATCRERKDKNPLRVFDCKNPTCQEMYSSAPKVTDALCATCQKEWEDLKSMLHQLSVSYSVAPHLVRGLDYYTKTVFEFVSMELGAQSTFCGGGRYDGLAQTLGEKEQLPAIGAAMGIERLVLMLQESKNKLVVPQAPPLYVILPMQSEQHTLALLLADTLQARGFCIDVLLEGDSLKSMMRTANKMGAQQVLIIGSEEQKNRTVTIKNMTTGAEQTVAQAAAAEFLKG